MTNASLALGVLVMFLGVSLIVGAALAALRPTSAFAGHGLWILPTLGLGLILLGRWMIQ